MDDGEYRIVDRKWMVVDTQCIIPEEATREFRRLECDLESSFPGRIIVSVLAISCQAILWMVLAK